MVKVFVSHSTSLQAKYAFTPKDAADLHVLVASSRHFGPDGSLEEDGVGVGDAHELQEHAQYPPTGNPLASLSGEEQEVHDGLQAAGIRHPHRFQPFLKNLHRAFYRTSDDFKGATREGLNQAGLVNVLGLVDAIMECQAAAATTSAGTSAASPGLYEDKSAQLAAEMLPGLVMATLPAGSEEVKAMLADHSNLRLPVSYGALAAISLTALPSQLSKVCAVSSSGKLVDLISTLLNCGMVELGSESSTTVSVSFMLCHLFETLGAHFNLSAFKFLGNRSETGTSTSSIPPRKRPDLLGIVNSATLYVAEDKKPGLFMAAHSDMQEYMKAGLSSHHYGDVKYILGHVAADPELQFIVVTCRGEVHHASDTFNLNSVGGRIDAVCTLINVMRLLGLMRSHLPPAEHRMHAMFQPFIRGPTSVTLTNQGAVKRISDFTSFAAENVTTFSAMEQAYSAARTAAFEELSQGRKPFLIYGDVVLSASQKKYEACTQPLGYFSRPSDEQDLQRLALACCKTALTLHRVHLVHRDFRLANVVRLTPDAWMVIDLELCSKAPVQLPGVYSQEGWTLATTEPHGESRMYSTWSDMHQIGAMLDGLLKPSYSATARAFVRSLLDKKLSAELALQHEWLVVG